MAGETPDASRVGKQRNKAGKRLTHLDEKKTDKYYASGSPSAINNSPADSRGNVAAKPQANNVGFGALDERSADKKYYKERTLPGQKPVARHLAKAIQAAPTAGATRAVSELTIRTGVEVNPVMDEVVRRIQNGDTEIIVTVAAIVMRRARAKLDTLVTRELITEEQSRDVRFSRLMDEAPTEAAADVPPVPTETIRTEDVDADVAIDDILSGNASLDEDGPSTAPENVHEVDDDSDEPSVAAPEATEEAETADPLDAATEAPAETEEAALSPEDSEEADDDADDSDVAQDEESDEDEESDA